MEPEMVAIETDRTAADAERQLGLQSDVTAVVVANTGTHGGWQDSDNGKGRGGAPAFAFSNWVL
jgi:hypothetical protein